jgi:hypothetical protein
MPANLMELRLNLLALGDAAIPGVCEYNCIFITQKSVRLCDFELIGSAYNRIKQTRLSVCANETLHPKFALVDNTSQEHNWDTHPRDVLVETGSGNKNSFNCSNRFKSKPRCINLSLTGENI